MKKMPAHLAAEKRRLPRFHISPCQFHDRRMDKNFSVQDISLGGLAIRLVDHNDLGEFAVGSDHPGVVKLDGVKIDGQFRVRFIRGLLIGAEWVNASRELIEHLDKISHAEALGKGLKKFEIAEMPDITWFHHPVGIDLLLYASGVEGVSGIHRWILYYHQGVIHWEKTEGLRTGRALAEDDEGQIHGVVRLETRLMDYDDAPNPMMLETARELFESAAVLGPELKGFLQGHLKTI